MNAARTNLLTTAEVARRLMVSKRQIYRLAGSGDLRVIRIGAATRYAEEDIQAFIDKRRGATGRQGAD